MNTEKISLSDDQVQDFIEKAKKLEDERNDLEKQINLVIATKQTLEQLLTKERKTTAQLKEQLEAGSTVTKGSTGEIDEGQISEKF